MYQVTIHGKYIKATNIKTKTQMYICTIKSNMYKEWCKKLKTKDIDNQTIKGYKLKKILRNYY